MAGFSFDNSYARDLPGFYVRQNGASVPAPRLVKLNTALAEELGLDAEALAADPALFTGMAAPEGAEPLAMAYAGHQFGQFSPQLGDGRALLLGEVIDRHGQRRDIHLKGSGRTPFSRGGDGKAALGPVLREYLIGEAMHALGIPTTRALAAVTTGETIYRDALVPGAVLARVASSHLRVGTFQFFAPRGEGEKLGQLLHYAIHRHAPACAAASNPALAFLAEVRDRQAALIARWMLIGFVHGVMNTDNMALSGETIDYGPCAFMEAYDPATVFSSIDHGGRYAYGNQPGIALWNLARFAESLLPLIDEDADTAVEQASAVLHGFQARYQQHWFAGMRAKLGLAQEQAGDLELVAGLDALMQRHKPDFTGLFRVLIPAAAGEDLAALVALGGEDEAAGWLSRWRARLGADVPASQALMSAHNPVYIPRNHLVEAALQSAVAGDMAPFDQMLGVVQAPFTERAGLAPYAHPAPSDAPHYRTFCGT